MNKRSEKKKRITFFSITLIIIFLLCTIEISALGISPSRKIIDYDTEQHIITSKIINNEARDINIKISASGELAEYIFISEPIINIKSSEPEKEFTYVLQLPPNIGPGPHIISITASEINENTSENSIGGILALTQQLQINVPYTGIYAEGYLSVYATNINNPVNTLCEIFNRGDQNIESMSGTLKILDADNNTVYTKEISKQENIAPKESARVDETFFLKEIGAYQLECNINYDGKNLIVKKDFTLGQYNITILKTDVKNFKLGTIAKFDINLLSDWNTAIDNVYGEITIKDKNGILVGQTNITKTTINPHTNFLSAYLDTLNMNSGEYLIRIKLYAGNKIIIQDYTTIISSNNIDLITTTETKNGPKNNTLAVVLIFSALSILIIIILRQNKKLYK